MRIEEFYIQEIQKGIAKICNTPKGLEALMTIDGQIFELFKSTTTENIDIFFYRSISKDGSAGVSSLKEGEAGFITMDSIFSSLLIIKTKDNKDIKVIGGSSIKNSKELFFAGNGMKDFLALNQITNLSFDEQRAVEEFFYNKDEVKVPKEKEIYKNLAYSTYLLPKGGKSRAVVSSFIMLRIYEVLSASIGGMTFGIKKKKDEKTLELLKSRILDIYRPTGNERRRIKEQILYIRFPELFNQLILYPILIKRGYALNPKKFDAIIGGIKDKIDFMDNESKIGEKIEPLFIFNIRRDYFFDISYYILKVFKRFFVYGFR